MSQSKNSIFVCLFLFATPLSLGCDNNSGQSIDTDSDSISTAATDDTDSALETVTPTDSDTLSSSETDTGSETDSESDSLKCAGGHLDETTNLCWQNPEFEPDMKDLPESPEAYCDELELAGRDDWRLPNIDELRSLIRYCSKMETGGACEVHDGSDLDDYDSSCKTLDCTLPDDAKCHWPDWAEGDCKVGYTMSSSLIKSTGERWVVAFPFGKIDKIPGFILVDLTPIRCIHD